VVELGDFLCRDVLDDILGRRHRQSFFDEYLGITSRLLI
jgi:hypothetical protein